MDTDKKVKPALTAEEWAQYLPALKGGTATRDLNIEAALHTYGPEAAAALALYGYFTNEHAAFLHRLWQHQTDPEILAGLDEIIGLIDALLPDPTTLPTE
jgi:hypothetical protein